MARIAFAWELGGSYGHALASAALAHSLAARGHRIALVFRELHQLALLPEARHFDVFQAPRSSVEGAGRKRPDSYAEILLGSGYSDARELTALLGGWLSLWRRWKPDLVVADFAPTALAAARIASTRRVTYGNGFFTPPRLNPLPAFRHDEPIAQENVVRADREALASLNAAFAALGAPPLATLSQMFETDDDFICTFPELDHYGSRPESGYWGPRLRFDQGAEIEWPPGGGQRIFVYLQRDLAQLDAVIAWLARSPHRVISFIPDLDERRRAQLAARHRTVAERPLRLDRLLKQCDLMVCHGGEIAAGAIMYGVPQLLFPTHYEQYLLARRIELLGAGGWIGPAGSSAHVATAFERLLGDASFAAACRAFAKRYAAYSPQEQRRRVVARIEQIIEAAPTSWGPPPTAPILSPSSKGEIR
jgi:UDP:flavonoid glycosyltransferase YjiC (YdhE family)